MKDTSGTFLLGPEAWLKGDRRFGIPGSVNGNQFNRVHRRGTEDLRQRRQELVAFSSSLSIMMWTLLTPATAARACCPSIRCRTPVRWC